METKNIMIVGVGGQGTLLASKLLGRILLENGYDVKVSEVHGMSQRGGSVVTYVRYGEKVYSPIIDKGEADFVLSFELLEGGRRSADQYAEGHPPAGHYRRGGVPEGAGEKACGASHPPRRDGRAGACAQSGLGQGR